MQFPRIPPHTGSPPAANAQANEVKTRSSAKSQRRFDKQLFEAGQQCQKRLYLDYHDPVEEPESESRRVMSETGKQLLQLAKSAFARGAEVEGTTLEAASKKTTELLASGTVFALFGAAFVAEGVEVRSDILVRQKDGSLDIFEVKSGTKVKGRYLTDLALQALTIERAGHKVRGIYVLYLDKTYKHAGGEEYTPKGLIKSADVTERVRRILPRVDEQLQSFMRQVTDDSVLELPTGTFCAAPFPCPHLARCSKQEAEFPLRLLPDLTRDLERELHEEGIADFSQLDPARASLTFRQRRTLQAAAEGSLLKEPFVKEELQQVEFPLHFLSIATATEALPRFQNQKPWQPVPYAWACETVTEGGKVTHASFAHADKDDPRPQFAQTLGKHLNSGGMMILWDADSLESIRLLLESLPTEKQAIRATLARPHLDLRRLLESGLFHPKLLANRDLASTAHVLCGIAQATDKEVTDEDSALRALQKAATPRIRAATKEKLASEIKDWVQRQSSMMHAIYRTLSERTAAAAQEEEQKPAKKTVGPRKQLPPTPVEE